MSAGLAINRHWVIVLNNGLVVVDWGEGVFQDILSGDFIHEVSLNGSHTILDQELEWLKRTANIAGFDEHNVYVQGLPENPKKTLE
jgi:hypothetical protein